METRNIETRVIRQIHIFVLHLKLRESMKDEFDYVGFSTEFDEFIDWYKRQLSDDGSKFNPDSILSNYIPLAHIELNAYDSVEGFHDMWVDENQFEELTQSLCSIK